MTPGEIRRSIDRIEGSQRDAHKAIDDRLAEVARKSVPVELWASENKALADDLKHLGSDFRDAVDRIERTSQERMTTLRGEIAGVRSEVSEVRKAQDRHVKAHEADKSWSRSKTLTVIAIVVGAAATLTAAYIAAFAAAGGVGR
jgi:chromosome segregation ATPase